MCSRHYAMHINLWPTMLINNDYLTRLLGKLLCPRRGNNVFFADNKDDARTVNLRKLNRDGSRLMAEFGAA